MEDLLSVTNVADVLVVGEKCFEDELYQVAKLLTIHQHFQLDEVGDYPHLPRGELGDCGEREEGRKYPASILLVWSGSSLMVLSRVWKEVGAACIEKEEFRLVNTSFTVTRMRLTGVFLGSNFIVHAVSIRGPFLPHNPLIPFCRRNSMVPPQFTDFVVTSMRSSRRLRLASVSSGRQI